MNIIKEGVRGAFVRIIRLITYSIIILIIAYVIGLITSSKASALVVKNTTKSITFTNGHTYSHNVGNNVNSAWEVHEFNLQTPITSQADLIGFQVRNFSIKSFVNGSTGYYVDYCEAISQNSNGTNYSCNTHFNPSATYYHGPDSYYKTYAQVLYTSGYIGTCWSSGEYTDFVMCQNIPNDSIKQFIFVVTISNGPLTSVSYQYTIANFVMELNYDQTDLINSQGQIITQQQQTNTYIQQQNTYITDTSTTTSQTQATTSLNTLSSTFDDTLNGWGGEWSTLTHVILEPINVVLYAFDSNTTCSPIVLNVPYMQNKTIELPCMSTVYNGYFGTFISLFIMIMSGLYCYRTILYVIRTIKEVLDAENDKIEVIDL